MITNHHKKKRRLDQFYDEIASVSDDDEGDDYDSSDDEEDDHGGFITNEEEVQGEVPYIVSREDHSQYEDIVKGINDRWHSQGTNRTRDYDDDVTREREPDKLNDPKLWIVRCRPGYERTVCLDIMKNYFKLKNDDKSLKIFSVISLEHNKGYVYVEAKRVIHVNACLNNVTDIFHSKKLKLIPMHEMKDVLRIPVKKRLLKKGDWVRVRSGLYKGDLAQVNDYDNSTGEALIRLIPRLNLSELQKKHREREDSDSAEGESGAPKKKENHQKPDLLQNFSIEMKLKIWLIQT
jgi:transcription elongation factor SPT5